MVQQGSPRVEAKAIATVMSDEQLLKFSRSGIKTRQDGKRDLIIHIKLTYFLAAQAKISYKAGQEDEKAKVKGIYKDAGDLKELENRIREYLNE